MRFAASNVTGGIVPNSGHWIMEENPQATIKLVTHHPAEHLQLWPVFPPIISPRASNAARISP